MMAFRIENHREPVLKAKPFKSEPYLKWIRQLPCILSGRKPVEAAHLSTANPKFGHSGRGKSQKASDRWVLPLSPDLHLESHTRNEMAFWARQVPSLDLPYIWCLTLWGIYSDGGDSLLRAEKWMKEKT